MTTDHILRGTTCDPGFRARRRAVRCQPSNNCAPVAIPLSADLAAVAIASMQGAIFAAKVDNHRIDLLGVGVVGTATGLGGAFIRDILLNVTPAALTTNWYLPVAVIASMVGMMLVRLIARLEPFWVVLDALTVGMYAAI